MYSSPDDACDTMQPMIRNHFYHILFAVSVLASALLAFGCNSPSPIRVVITPTPNQTAMTDTPSPSLAEAQPSATPTALPPSPTATTETAAPTATETPLPTTELSGPTQTPANFIGPAVDPDYTPSGPPERPTDEDQDFADIPTVTSTPLPPTTVPAPSETPGPTPTPVPKLDASMIGVQAYNNMGYDQWMQVIGATETLGVGWIKVQVNWAFLQPEGPQQFGQRFEIFERQMEAVKRHGFNTLLSVVKAPDWARSTLEESGPPDDPQAYADFLTFMLQETKVGGVTDAIEVWNEPNLIREWRGNLPFNGSGYMQIFRPAYDAIRAYSPDITIVSAGLAPTSNLGDSAIDDRVYLQQMYDAGLAQYNDIVIGAHPYGWGNPPDTRCCNVIAGRSWDDNPHFFFLENLEATHQIMQNNGHGDRQIWVTEFGWPTWEGLPSEPPEEWVTYNSADDQANYTIRAFEIGQQLNYVGPMFLWNLNFANAFLVEQSAEVAGYSLINPVISPSERPLYWALARATGALDATATPEDS